MRDESERPFTFDRHFAVHCRLDPSPNLLYSLPKASQSQQQGPSIGQTYLIQQCFALLQRDCLG